MKVAFVLCDLAIVLLLFDVLRRSRQPVHWVLAYAWNPLLATDVAGSGHIDILGALLLLISVAALWRNRRALAAVAFALAIAVKFLPDCACAAFLATPARSRRLAGSVCFRTALSALSGEGTDSNRLVKRLRAELSF